MAIFEAVFVMNGGYGACEQMNGCRLTMDLQNLVHIAHVDADTACTVLQRVASK